MADDRNDKKPKGDDEAPKVHDKRKIDPETGEPRVTEAVGDGFRHKKADLPVVDSDEPAVDEAQDADDIQLIATEGPEGESTDEDLELLA